MTNDIQLANPPLPPASLDLWSQPHAMDPHVPGQGLRKIHRLLRGRYALAIVLGLICAAAGGAAGFLSQKPLYRSDGLILITPNSPTISNLQEVMPMYTTYVLSQVALIQDQRVIRMAMSGDAWKSTGRGVSPDGIAEFADNLDVENVKASQVIRVSFTDKEKDVAPKAVKAVIQAYKDLFGDVRSKDTTDRLQYFSSMRDTLSNTLRGKRDQILAIGKPYGTIDLEVLHNGKIQAYVLLEAQLAQARSNLDAAQTAMGTKDKAGREQGIELTIEEIGERDKTMAGLLSDKQQQLMRVQRLERTLAPNHRQVLDAKGDLELLDQQIEKRAADFRKKPNVDQISPDGSQNLTITPKTIEQLTNRVAYLTREYDRARTAAAEIGDARVKIQGLQNDIEAAKDQLAQTNRTIENLTVQTVLSPQLEVASWGSEPVSPTSDPRKKFGILGFVGGGALPVLLLMLIGLLDQRYRYSDDAGSDMGGITLLGILPNLPDRLTDPEQASIAAHCVHQIRTMLQINGPADRRVFAITSASPQDGKTSLTLALGLSFAASGSRTLLIDCDLVGGGLSSRLNVTSPEGILEAITNRTLLEYVRTTDITDLAILPVGSSRAHHASTLSPSVLKRLVDTARQHFDTILIDTGPILGSIEASLVVTAADAVVLTVARGQQRPLVEKSLSHLRSIGARLAGVVFNRAQARDFDRSVSRMSLRSTARTNGNGHAASAGDMLPSNRFGPVARAVATSVKPSNGNDQG